MEILLVKIPQVVFFPFAIASVIGIALFPFFKTVKNRKKGILFIIFIVFQISWRCFLPSFSKRYACALIFPALFFAAFASIYLWNILIKNLKENRTVFHCLSCGTFLGLIFWELLAFLNYNPFDKLIINNSNVIAMDASQFSEGVRLYSFSDTYLSRTDYYLPKNRKDIIVDQSFFSKQIGREIIIKFIKKLRYDTRPSYFIVSLPAASSEISFRDIFISQNKWNKIASFFVSRNKKKKVSLYRLIPFRPEENEKTRTVGNQLLINGDFSKTHLQLYSELKKRGIPFFQREVIVPDNWAITTPGAYKGSMAEFEHFIQDDVNTMRMKCTSYFTVFNRTQNSTSDYLFQFSVRSATESKLSVSVHTYNKDHAWNSFDELYVLNLPQMKTFQRYSILFRQSDFHAEAAFFRICFKLDHGEIFLSNTALHHLQ